MKILLYTDVHWSETSSIVRGRGSRYSIRLENLINSVNWAESVAGKMDCDLVVCLGDFFDKPTLTAEEITALKEIKWLDIPHYFLVGNHDANINDLSYASTFVFSNNDFHIVSFPMILRDSTLTCNSDVLLLPYIMEDSREGLETYFRDGDKMAFTKRIVLSHNDLAGVNYGQFVSQVGFDISDILNCCDLFINGHLHNAGFVDSGERILNLGNLSGQNFSEDATKYKHYCAVLDTNTLEITYFENPYAFNFYKLVIMNDKDLTKVKLGANAVLSIQCSADMVQKVKERCNGVDVIASRITTIVDTNNVDQVDISSLADTDYLQQFSEFILEHMDHTQVLMDELSRVVR